MKGITHPVLDHLPDTPELSAARLREALVACISPRAEAALREGQKGLVIGGANRATILRMLDTPHTGGGTVRRADLVSLIGTLGAFLEQYMADRPEGHLWIVLCCVYLSMVVREPMHPQRFAHWYRDGAVYRCPARENTPESVCLWCVCQSKVRNGGTL